MESSSSSRLKQRLTRLFRPSTLLRSSCNSSSSSIFTSSAATSTISTATAADEPFFIPHDSLFLRRLDRSLSSSSRVLSTLDCTRCGPNGSADLVVSVAAKGSEGTAKKERRVRETGELYETGKREGRTCPPASPASPAKDLHKKKQKKKKTLSTNAYGFSSSSDDGSNFFSGADETETFLSSRSFSSDSSEFYKRPKKTKKKKKSASSRIPPRMCRRTTGHESGAIPVIKRSTDPYVDFRDSMAEMIVERQIFGATGLEKLLLSYLSLNSPLHHPLILRAFSDISRVLFGH